MEAVVRTQIERFDKILIISRSEPGPESRFFIWVRHKCLETYIKHLFREQNCVNKTNSIFIFQKKDF